MREPRFRSRQRAPRRASRVPARPRRVTIGRGGAVGVGIILALLTIWALGASWTGFDARQTITRLMVEQADARRLSEDKVKALTRRLVGVASHQILEQDGLEGSMADLITRQVQLESRQAVLTALAEQIVAPASACGLGAADPGTPASSPRTKAAEATPVPAPGATSKAAETPVPTLRLGLPSAAMSDPSAVTPPALPDGPERRGQTPGPASRLHALLPLRERFTGLQSSMDLVETAQIRSLDGFLRQSHDTLARARTAVVELGLDLDRLDPGLAKLAVGGPLVPASESRADPFEAGVQRVERSLMQVARLPPLGEALPFRRPIEGDNNLTSNFGQRTDPFTGALAMHAGMDFRAETGTPVRATGAGRVINAEVTGGYGNLVEIDHGGGITTRYGHLSSMTVARGQSVTTGAVVGLVGSTGRSTGPHLHYETRVAGGALDPQRFLRVGALFAPDRGTQHGAAPVAAPEPPGD